MTFKKFNILIQDDAVIQEFDTYMLRSNVRKILKVFVFDKLVLLKKKKNSYIQ